MDIQMSRSEIESTMLSVISFEDLKRMAVVNVTVPSNDINIPGSVNDPRMGPITFGQNCDTCKKNITQCPGHYGMIEFTYPILHPLFIREAILCLQSIKLGCKGLRLTKNQIMENNLMKLSKTNRLKAFAALSQKESVCDCNGCVNSNSIKYDITKSLETRVVRYGFKPKEDNPKIMPIETIIAAFSSLSEEDIRMLGFDEGTQPLDFIMRGIPVIPPNIRIPQQNVGEEFKNVHLTAMYITIIEVNNSLAEDGLQENKIDDLMDRFRYYIWKFIDNNKAPFWTQGKGNQAYKGINQRLKGKKELRGHGMGKRVDFSARTVIGPDLNVEFGQTRVPEAFRKNLLILETINYINKDVMMERLKAGTIASYIKKSDGIVRMVYSSNKDNIELKIGDKVNRYLENGDLVLQNRQPSLHSFSMRSMEAVINPNTVGSNVPDTFRPGSKTTGIVLADTGAFNADFDGDEMNTHVARSEEAKAELAIIASNKACLINPQSDTPVVGQKLDVISGANMMTITNQRVEEADFLDNIDRLTIAVDIADLKLRAEKHKLELLTTKVLFSALFPRDFFYNEYGVTIKDGILISGVVKNDHLGTKSRSMLQILFIQELYLRGEESAKDVCTDFLTNTSRLVNYWMRDKSLSFGLSDCAPSNRELHKKIVNEIIEETKLKISALGSVPEDELAAEKYEQQVKGYLNISQTVGEKVSHLYISNNPFLNVIKSLIYAAEDVRIEAGDENEFMIAANEVVKKLQEVYGLGDELSSDYILDVLRDVIKNDYDTTDLISKAERYAISLKNEQKYDDASVTIIKDILNNIANAKNIAKYVEKLKTNNNSLFTMTSSGAKGGAGNLAQITSLIGQQYLKEKRLLPKQKSGRTLSYWDYEDESIESAGFISSNFYEGINPSEYFFLMVSGRQGLIDTANTTQEVGYLNHRLVKALEDLKVEYDNSVRNSSNSIVSPLYGYDGYSGDRVIRIKRNNGDVLTSFVDIKLIANYLNET